MRSDVCEGKIGRRREEGGGRREEGRGRRGEGGGSEKRATVIFFSVALLNSP
jgi:hypothetical protein